MQRNEYHTEYVSLTCRVTAPHAELVHRVATAQGVSAADWMRRAVLTAAADVENVAIDLSSYTTSGLINTAAKALGMTAREFASAAAREAAAKVLSERAPLRTQAPPPMTTKSSESGTRYAQTHARKTAAR